jgi:hypothetical protein
VSSSGGLNKMDKLMLVWAAWALVASGFHEDPNAALSFNGGLVYNTCGVYFLLRIFCQSIDDVVLLCRIAVVLLIPVSLEMVYEKVAVSNLFSLLGGVPDVPNIREGKIRAQGPFAHSILGGTVGAVFLPVCVGLWHRYPLGAMAGSMACMAIVITSTSSGPLLSAIFSIGALLMWSLRHRMKAVRTFFLSIYLLLMVAMEAPPYYLMARIDLSGGSTGYHRARLIESSMDHLNEWWLYGTDHTRHWMATGVTWSPHHTDITNHYLMMGVLGGLPLMLLFIAVLTMAFSTIGKAIRAETPVFRTRRFFLWALGASLFAHVASCISVYYFDQSFVFLYIAIASIGTVQAHLEPVVANDTARPAPIRGTPAGVAEAESALPAQLTHHEPF